MEDELTAILSPISTEVIWRSLDTSTGSERQCGTKLAVIHFMGSCGISDLTSLGAIGATLGTTHISDTDIQPFCDIYSDAIRAQVAPVLATLDSADRPLLYGRAIGRVLAHELYHIFGQSKGHSRSGLMRSSYSAENLTTPEIRFENPEYEKLRTSLAVPTANRFNAKVTPPGMALFLASGCGGCHGFHQQGTPFGPPLLIGKKVETSPLAARLTLKVSTMFRRARSMKAIWPSFSPRDIAEISAFLIGQSLHETQ